MTKIKNIAKKIILCVLIILSFVLAQNSILLEQVYFDKSIEKTDISLIDNNDPSNQQDISDEKISNNRFDVTTPGSSSTSSSSYTGNTAILTPSNWTKAGTVNQDLFIGVIDIAEQAFNSNYENYSLKADESPRVSAMSGTKENVLMINTKTSSTFGYTTPISLDASSFYAIEVNYFTGSNASASVCLSGTNFDGNEKAILATKQSNNWSKATIYVATNQIKSASTTLGLYLGTPQWGTTAQKTSQGHVFFDNVKVIKYSKNYFDSLTKTFESNGNCATFIDFRYSNITSDEGFVENGNFNETTTLTDANSKWTPSSEGSSSISIVNGNVQNFDAQVSKTNARTNDDKIVMVYNSINTDGSSKASIKSSNITIKQNGIYRISFWAKTNTSSIIASVEPTDTINGNTYEAATISNVSTTQDQTTNGWNEYVFYVNGNTLKDATITLTLGLQSTNNKTAEYAFFDDITSQKISSSDLKETNSQIKNTLNLNPTSSATIKNGYFNTPSSTSTNSTYPYAVADWTYQGITKTTNVHGIINLENDLFSQARPYFSGTPTSKPASSFLSSNDISNNVLLLNNGSSSYQTYLSDSNISVTANSTYVLTINLFTDILDSSKGGINLYLTNSNGVKIAELNDIQTNRQWKTYSIYFKNYSSSQTLTLKLGFGRENKQVSGFAYFDNCVWKNYSGSIENIAENDTTKIVNLSKDQENADTVILTEDFSEYEKDAISESNDLNNPFLWAGEVKATITNEDETITTLSDADIISGVLNQNNLDVVLNGAKISADPYKTSLMIYSPSDTYYSYSNRLTYSLSSNSFYKVSVKVKTIDLSQSDENQQTVDGTIEAFGASIILDGIDQKFTGINTNGTFGENDEGWLEYVFYINTTDALDLKLNLALGSEKAWTSGYVFFDEANVIKMTEDQFNLDMNVDLEDTEKQDRVISVLNTSNSDEPTPDQPRSYSESLAWLSIPTLLIAIGIILALIGFLIKRHIENRPVKVTVRNNYDRSTTILQDLDQKNYKTSLNHKLKLLKEELAQTEQYLKEEQEEHQKQVEAFETAKEIAEQDNSIKLENPDKKYSEYEQTVSKLEQNIASIKADIQILEEEKKQLDLQNKLKHQDDLKGNKITRRK